MTPLLFVAAVLAVFCVSTIVSQLGGPGGIFSRLRRKAKGSVKDGIKCPFCSSVWIAAGAVSFLCWREYCPWVDWPFFVFAISGGSYGLHLLLPNPV